MPGCVVTGESVAAKAARYLREGRLTVCGVGTDGITATCRGSVVDPTAGQAVRYRLGWNGHDGWWCDCPSTTDRCTHLTALRLVTVVLHSRSGVRP